MSNRAGIVLVAVLAITLSFIVYRKSQITVFLVGDSTMSIKEPRYYPETGWGMPFAYFFDSTVLVDNRAKNGRSTKTFIQENLWKKVLDELKENAKKKKNILKEKKDN